MIANRVMSSLPMGTAPVIEYSDSFNRADSDINGTSLDVGGVWNEVYYIYNEISIVDNRLINKYDGDSNIYRPSVDATATDIKITGDLGFTGNTGNMLAGFYYFLRWNGNTSTNGASFIRVSLTYTQMGIYTGTNAQDSNPTYTVPYGVGLSGGSSYPFELTLIGDTARIKIPSVGVDVSTSSLPVRSEKLFGLKLYGDGRTANKVTLDNFVFMKLS